MSSNKRQGVTYGPYRNKTKKTAKKKKIEYTLGLIFCKSRLDGKDLGETSLFI